MSIIKTEIHSRKCKIHILYTIKKCIIILSKYFTLAPEKDAATTVTHYPRTHEQDVFLGLAVSAAAICT